MDVLLHLLLVALATATLSMTIAKTNVARPLHEIARSYPKWVQFLLQCPYCLNHWFAFAILLLDLSEPISVGTFFEQWLACVALASIAVGCMFRLLFVGEAERGQMASMLNDAVERAEKAEAEVASLKDGNAP